MMATCPRNMWPVTPSGRTVKFCQQLRTVQWYVDVSGILDDSGPSADTCFDVLAHSLLLSRSLSANIPFSQRACQRPSAYVHTMFGFDLVPAKSVGKMSRQTQWIVQVNNGRILCEHIAITTKPSPQYVLTESTIFCPWRSINSIKVMGGCLWDKTSMSHNCLHSIFYQKATGFLQQLVTTEGIWL